jgi:hypothetical protein
MTPVRPLYSSPNKLAAFPLDPRPRPCGEGSNITRVPWLAETGATPSGPKISSDPENGFRSHFRRLGRYAEPNGQKARGVQGMEKTVKAIARPAASRSLREAIRKARLEEAERLDVTADRRDGEIARLELLKSALEAVFVEIPRQDDRFNLVLVPSRPARLWIDLFSYAAIDDATGAYLFIRNSENGRRTLFSSTVVADMSDRITSYMAREIVRRERLEAALLEPVPRDKIAIETDTGASMGVVIAAFVVGMLTGAAGLFAAVWLSVP